MARIKSHHHTNSDREVHACETICLETVAEVASALKFIFSPSADKRYPSEDELKRLGAKLIHFDRQVDVAILGLNDAIPIDRQPLVISESKVKLQTNVIAVGNPGYGKGRYLPLDTSAGLVTNNNPLMTNAEVKEGQQRRSRLRCSNRRSCRHHVSQAGVQRSGSRRFVQATLAQPRQ